MNRQITVLIGFIAVAGIGFVIRSAQQRASDVLPSWEWIASRELLTVPISRCGPILESPGNLRHAELLAWRTLRDTLRHQEVHDVLWWGQFENSSNEQRWVVTVGQQRAVDSAWTHNYVCDGNKRRYLVLDHPPRTADLRPLALEMFQTVGTPWIDELHIRAPTWRRLLRDPPSLAVRTVP